MNNQCDILRLLIQSFDESKSPSDYLDSNTLCSLIDSDSIDIRVWMAKALINHSSANVAVPLLCKLANDNEACVRVEAIDSLSEFVCQESFNTLCYATDDEDELVRAYAAFGIAFVGRIVSRENALCTLLDIEKTETSRRALIGIYEGIYLLERPDALYNLFNLFDSNDYHIQCAVLHAIMEIVNEKNKSIIKKFVDSLDASKFVYAVADSIQKIKDICS